MSNIPMQFNGIKDTDNKLSGDSIAYSFRLNSKVNNVRSKELYVVKPIPKGGVTIMDRLSFNKSISLVLIFAALLTAVVTISGKGSFSVPGAIIIVVFSLFAATLMWSDKDTKGQV